MSKKEEIIINGEYEYPRVSKKKLTKDKLYKEFSPVITREIILNKELSSNGQLKQIEDYLDALRIKVDKIIKDFLFLKLFKYTINNNDDIKMFASELKSIDGYFIRFNSDFRIVDKFFDTIRPGNILRKTELTMDEIENVYNQVVNLYSYLNGLKEEISLFQKKYYHEFRLSSYSLIRNKKVSDIEDLILRVEKDLSQFKNISDANDYYIYNSGNEIMGMVNEFVKLKKKDNNILSYHYFLNQDAIIAFKYTEWIELYIKFNYVLERIGKSVMYTSEFKKRYSQLETRYAIVLIHSEIYK